MAAKKNYNSDGRSAEDRTLDKFAELLIEKLETIQADWKKPWFTEGVTASLPKNLSGREYNGMNSMMLMLHAEKASGVCQQGSQKLSCIHHHVHRC